MVNYNNTIHSEGTNGVNGTNGSQGSQGNQGNQGNQVNEGNKGIEMYQKDVQVYGNIVISSENKILLVRGRKTGKWSFPKGHPYKSETNQECANRETVEESGIQISGCSDESLRLATGIYYIHRIDNQPKPRTLDTDEIIDVDWWTIHQIKRLSANIDVSYFLKKHGNYLWEKRPCPSPSLIAVV